MKKTISILLATVCIIGLVGCGSKKGDAATASQPKETVVQKQNDSSNKAQDSTSQKDNSNKDNSQNSNPSNNLNENLITKDFNEVSSMKVVFNNSNKTYSIEKDKEVIKKVYDNIVNTKVSVHNGSQDSDQLFTVNIVYKSGETNVIHSTETGLFLFRIMDNKTSWIGGENKELLEIMKNIK